MEPRDPWCPARTSKAFNTEGTEDHGGKPQLINLDAGRTTLVSARAGNLHGRFNRYREPDDEQRASFRPVLASNLPAMIPNHAIHGAQAEASALAHWLS